jgi:hypothetical protein
MPTPLDFPARGKVLRVQDNLVVFSPAGTTYGLHLVNKAGDLPVPSNSTIHCYIRAVARKIWTIATGGNFITPIIGTPRIVQGRVRYLDEDTAVIQAGAPIIIALPPDAAAFDLINGPVTPNSMINATLLPGATFELAKEPAAQNA